MRLVGIALVVLVLLTACTEHGQGGAVICRFMGENHVPGDFFEAGDGCNVCECGSAGSRGVVTCSEQVCTDGGIVDDGGETACAAAAGCAGPVCGGACCGQGERCDNGVCSCGGDQACANGDFCTSAGPVGGDGGCGTICCGGIENPCPL